MIQRLPFLVKRLSAITADRAQTFQPQNPSLAFFSCGTSGTTRSRSMVKVATKASPPCRCQNRRPASLATSTRRRRPVGVQSGGPRLSILYEPRAHPLPAPLGPNVHLVDENLARFGVDRRRRPPLRRDKSDQLTLGFCHHEASPLVVEPHRKVVTPAFQSVFGQSETDVQRCLFF